MSETEKEDLRARDGIAQERHALIRVRKGTSHSNREKLWRDVFTNALVTQHRDPAFLADRAVMAYDLRNFQ